MTSALAKNNALEDPKVERKVASGQIVKRSSSGTGDPYIKRDSRADRPEILPFQSVLVPAGASMRISVRPQFLFRGNRLIVPDAIANFFDIVDLQVGKNSQFTTGHAIPASIFRDSAYELPLKFDTCHIAMDMTITVSNISRTEQRFSAVVAGRAIDY